MKPLAVLIAAAFLLSACVQGGGASRVPASTTGIIAQAGALLSVQRANAGIATPILHSPDLQAAAQFLADDLNRTGRFEHVASDGSTISDRIRATGYTACFAAENIAEGQPDARSAIASWVGSTPHFANIVNPNASQFGFARAGDIWVLVLARPC